MSFAIIFVVIVVGVWFFSDMSHKNKGIESRGGMLKKYDKIITPYIGEGAPAKVHKVGKDFIVFGIKDAHNSILFDLTETVSKTIEIKYESITPMSQKQLLKWSFKLGTDPEVILAKINQDIEKDHIRLGNL